jgi:hypothetical protein
MKKLIKDIITKVSEYPDKTANIFRSITKLQQNLDRARQQHFYNLNEDDTSKTFFKEKKVLNGPFANMLYPDFQSIGSVLYAKLLGSYEFELHDVINGIINGGYQQYLDIGCAEGYYAIGLALKTSDCISHAFDINQQALEQCRKMAIINNLNEKVFTYSKCDADTLASFDFSKKTFILADCEGYEKQLFNSSNVNSFKHADILIEVHNYIDDSISAHLLKLFSNTHKVEIIGSINDFQRPYIIKYTQLTNLDYSLKYSLLKERRPGFMQWFFFKSMN